MSAIPTPDGMQHVGWHCDHTNGATTHMSPKWSRKRQEWRLKKAHGVILAYSGLATSGNLTCPHARPTFVQVGVLDAA